MKGKTMSKKPYYYGDTNDHIVNLTENQAIAINETLITDIEETDNGTQARVLLPNNVTMDDYSSAADILNEYLENNVVTASDEYLAENDILRPVK